MTQDLNLKHVRAAPVDRVLRPFLEFAKIEASGGILLVACALVALVWANSPWRDFYHHLWETQLTVGFGGHQISKPLEFWINDGLMAVFFFVVGLEIKREFLAGELASVRHAALPIAAAFGGMLVPALIFYAFNRGTGFVAGWGIPMATDIAFALGALALLGKGIPVSLRIFLTALAIVDDLGAVLVIAVFYTADLNFHALGLGAVFFAALIAANAIGARWRWLYAILGAGLWMCFLESGIHATVAGVLCALAIPVRTRLDGPAFLKNIRLFAAEFEQRQEQSPELFGDAGKLAYVGAMEQACEFVQPMAQRMEQRLHVVVAFAIMPLFALANAGVHLEGSLWEAVRQPVALGVIAGLVVGKQIGITLFSFVVVKLGFAVLPKGASWRLLYGVSWLGGIGFTMSLFIASLAFPGEQSALDLAKAGILLASLIAGVIGFVLLKKWIRVGAGVPVKPA